MHTTPKPARFRPSLGEPSRVSHSRHRAQSPGTSSVGSAEDARSTGRSTSPRQRGGSGAVPSRPSSCLPPRQSSRGAISRNSRDPRPVGDRSFATQCARTVVEFLVARGYGKLISYDKLLKEPSTREFFEIFRYLISQIDPQLDLDGKLEDEVPTVMRRLRYPVEVNRSKLQAISGPNTWPQLLAVLDWLVALVRLNDDLVAPLAECQVSLAEGSDRDEGDHVLLRTLHNTYLGYLNGQEDRADEEALKQIYEERINALAGEVQRLQEHQGAMDHRIQAFGEEHERLLETQQMPAQLELEADKLRGIILSQEAHVQRLEEESARAGVEERTGGAEIEDLQAHVQRLTKQVQSQAYSKKDVERLKYERGHLQKVLRDLRGETERAEQEVWELNMQDSRTAEAIGRVTRQVNDAIEGLACDFCSEPPSKAAELGVCIDLGEPSDSLAVLDFTDLLSCAQASAVMHAEAVQAEEASLLQVQDQQRDVKDQLVAKERECRRLRERWEQLAQMREDYREWSGTQLDEATRTAETTEDAVHAVSVGTAAPSIRDAAEIDKLRLTLHAIQTQGVNERTQLEEQIQRDKSRFEDHRESVVHHLELYLKDVEGLYQELEGAIGGDEEATAAATRGGKAPRGGC